MNKEIKKPNNRFQKRLPSKYEDAAKAAADAFQNYLDSQKIDTTTKKLKETHV